MDIWHIEPAPGAHVSIKDENGLLVASCLPDDAPTIAAAPAMLAALQWLRDEYCEGGALDGTEAERVILAAITAATGEPIPSAPTVGD